MKEQEIIAKNMKEIIKQLGYDITNPSIKDTPIRVAKHLMEYMIKDEKELIDKLTFFEDTYDQIIVKKNIHFNSMCEHHMLPFQGTCTVAYLPPQKHKKTTIIGTSKLARIVEHFAQRFTIQERLTDDIANFLVKHTKSEAVWVIMSAVHLCEEIRGVKNSSEMITSAIRGLSKNHELKREFEILMF